MNAFNSFFEKNLTGREVKEMKKLFTVLLVAALTMSMPASAFAAFTVDDSEVFDASVLVSGTPQVTVPFAASLKNISNDNPASALAWSGITAGTTSWKAANQYAQVQGFATFSEWGIQIYTNNTNYTGTSDPAGLIREDNTLFSLPMCWRTRAGVKAIPHERDIYQGTSGAFQVLYDGVTPHDLDNDNPDDTTKIHAPGAASPYFPWFFMLDKRTPDVDSATAGNQAFGNYQAGATFIGSAGYHHAPGTVNYATPIATDTIYYAYFGANFTLAVPGKTYSTSSLTVEMYHL